jgi:predicted Ser/Thr protein kinase
VGDENLYEDTSRRCKFDEDPLGVLTTKHLASVPKDLRKLAIEIYKGELCDGCRKNIENILIEIGFEDVKKTENAKLAEMDVKKMVKAFSEKISNKVKVIGIGPKIASCELTDKDLIKNMDKIVAKANRGILHINVDDKKMDELPESNYQFLLRLADGKIDFSDGSSITIDLIPILYANQEFMESLKRNQSLYRRLSTVYVRRNLSYSNEEKILSKFEMPFTHISPQSLNIYSKFVVGSRIDYEYNFDEKKVGELIDLYEKFENFKPLKKEETDELEKRLFTTPPKDGWDLGFPSDVAYEKITSYYSKTGKKCFTLEDLQSLIRETSKEMEINNKLTSYCERLIKQTAFRDLAISFICMVENTTLDDIYKDFDYLVNLFRRKFVDEKETVKTITGEVKVEEEMEKIVKKLYFSSLDDVISSIKTIYTETQTHPTFQDFIQRYPYIVSRNEKMRQYLPWREIDRGLDKFNKEKLDKLIDKMKLLGYDETCALAAIRIASQEFG